ncbi:hypothetical protein BN59_02551 [Legionella massiliensis]|uniref:Inositolphosphotransferase Aur1/Ipt1 domain-containing protein n=1 Tax=Legionella massiliensis TaxID=1034943 RepID=A0A078KZ79_9GAMM|nr:phosphatase PAP2 family protein [Legionella massiliensis]CDZ78241.1 hypothetical protein BN59_02551 [Legionella massiliensis]CEE13979.1 hypothetical protein BN1094_02551 [Legionella massiliensis]
MKFITKYFNLLLSLVVIFLSSIALLYNYYFTGYPGNNYLFPQVHGMAAILLLALMGCYLLFGKESPYLKTVLELIYFYLVITIIALFATNAVQFTPFQPIDKHLIAIDSFFGIHLDKVVSWTVDRAWLRITLVKIYDSLPYQMSYLPLILIFARKFFYIREYTAYLLITTILGFSFYYFWPTVGPATAIGSPIFSEYQYATGLKFKQIHSYIQPTTFEGGMIAMPSFHVIWAVLSLNAVRCWPIVFALWLPINLILIASCVLLGWHYFVDLIGSLIVLAISFYIVQKFRPAIAT